MAKGKLAYTVSTMAGNSDRDASEKQRIENYISPNLHWRFLSIFGLLILLCIAGLEALNQASIKHQGLRSLSTDTVSTFFRAFSISDPKRSFSQLKSGAFFWSVIPTLVAQLINLLWAGVVTDLLTRQPFIELTRPQGSNASRTINLDYSAHNLLKRMWKLARNHHFFCLSALLVSLIMSFVLSPIASALFVSLPITRLSDTSLVKTTSFQGSRDVATLNLAPYVRLATGLFAYGSSPVKWSDSLFAFNHFSIDDTSTSLISSKATLQGLTNAYAATLDCRQVLDPVATSSSSAFTFTGSDRGCVVKGTILSGTNGLYSHVLNVNCADPTGRLLSSSHSSLRRIVYLLSYANGSTAPTNTTMISCIPSYSNSTALVSINATDATLITYELVGQAINLEDDFQSASLIEAQLPLQSATDPSNESSSDAMGELIVLALQKEGADLFDAAILVNFLPRAYAAMFSQIIAADFMSTANETFSGKIAVNELRLFVFPVALRVLQALLVLAFVSIICSLSYPLKYKVLLRASGLSILDRGSLLFGSNLMQDDRLAMRPEQAMEQFQNDSVRFVLQQGVVHMQQDPSYTNMHQP